MKEPASSTGVYDDDEKLWRGEARKRLGVFMKRLELYMEGL